MTEPDDPQPGSAGVEPAPTTRRSGSSAWLFVRAHAGDRSALEALFERQAGPLLRWARGRLPRWARTAADTADIVQDAILQTFRRLDAIEIRGPRALRAYLRQAVDNRIKDELRRVARRPVADPLDSGHPDLAPSPLDAATSAEAAERYKLALTRLRPQDRALVVGRFELGYSYEQLALMTDRPSAAAARVALQRAVVRLAEEFGGEVRDE
jgi:RNA polymerase sigma-70 factor (ECF subfamily)